MTLATGLADADPDAGFRREACRFADDRLSAAQKIAFVHELLRREMTDLRMLFDVIEKYALSLTPAERASAEVARALGEIARDASTRERYLAFTRDTDEPAVRARMLALARSLGWLAPSELNAEYRRMIAERLARGRRRTRRYRSRVLAQRPARARAVICRGPAARARRHSRRPQSWHASTVPRRTTASCAR